VEIEKNIDHVHRNAVIQVFGASGSGCDYDMHPPLSPYPPDFNLFSQTPSMHSS
jgi:hypothetical protein